jgi:hypothetical protein
LRCGNGINLVFKTVVIVLVGNHNRPHVLGGTHCLGIKTWVEQNSFAVNFKLEAGMTVLGYFHNVIVAHLLLCAQVPAQRSKLGFDETKRV